MIADSWLWGLIVGAAGCLAIALNGLLIGLMILAFIWLWQQI